MGGVSLKVRVAATFIAIYLAIFFGMLGILNMGQGIGARHRLGPNMAVTYAAEELRVENGSVQLGRGSRLADLMERNPGFWLLVGTGGPIQFLGSPPASAGGVFERYVGVVDEARLRLPGEPSQLSDAMVRRVGPPSGQTWIMAGGIDPPTISFTEAVYFFLVYEDLAPLLLIGGIGLLAMLGAVPLLSRALQQVADDAAEISPANPDRRVREAGVPAELLPVVRSFNATLDRLSDELGKRRRFIADVAHELRTPLAIASLQVERLSSEEAKADLNRIITRMSHLVGQMLDVERLSVTDLAKSHLDLRALASDTIADLAPMALAAGYELALEQPPDPVVVCGDAHALGRAIANMVSNAVSHGGGQGLIQVVVDANGFLEVIDDGPGVPSSLRENLFEPFTREPNDRDGCGLGLHLTREIMRAHGGDAVLVDNDRGAVFRLSIPVRQPPARCAPVVE